MQRISAIISLIICLASCKTHTWNELPGVTKINALPQTAFVPALEDPVDTNKNTAYAAAFLYAWNEVAQKLYGPATLSSSNSGEFKIVATSSSYKNALLPGEYTAEAELVDGATIAKAFFNKTLPFSSKMQRFNRFITFANTRVDAFGMQAFDEEIAKFAAVLYYKDNDHFVLRLAPKDTAHQILLVKGLPPAATLMAALRQTNDWINVGNREKNLPGTSWKYTLNSEDMFAIPVIKFNIETNYREIEGQSFTVNGKPHHAQTAYQRTGFILDENGAVVESLASMTTDSAAGPPKALPKKMIFDTPFFVFVGRTKSANPYFAMYVHNADLMVKQ